MAEGYVGVAPDGTGKKLRTRERVVGAATVQEQYVIVQGEAVPINRLWTSSLRIPSRAINAAGTQPLFTLWNGIASGGNNVSVRRLSVEIDSVAALAGGSPILRLMRMSTAGSGGTALTPVRQFTSDAALNALVVARADHQGDLASATTALVAGTADTNVMWSQTVPRAHTLVGFQVTTEYNMLPNDSQLMSQDPLILRPQEGALIRLDASAAAIAAAAFTFAVKAVLAEFTYPA